ncbi:hypothetical protein GCM10023205_53490 [Yinghuangia aomiensis]|uniref:Uncharacterized protein n=1 Tax=Yinghuangia aomiensis TaxID=676205 RepID=A0ABP9HV11_9ACTN
MSPFGSTGSTVDTRRAAAMHHLSGQPPRDHGFRRRRVRQRDARATTALPDRALRYRLNAQATAVLRLPI